MTTLQPLDPARERILLLTLAGIQFAHILDFMVMMPLGPILVLFVSESVMVPFIEYISSAKIT